MFNPTEIGEVELAVKEWLPKDGSISIEGTAKIVNYLNNKNKIYTRYALSVLSQYHKAFGDSDSIFLFIAWAISYIGLSDVQKSFTLMDATNKWLSQLEPKPGSVMDACLKYAKKQRIDFTQVFTELGICRTATGQFEELLDIIVPKTPAGVSVLAEKFNLEEDVLNKIFAATQIKGVG